jgi:gluconate 5-dehydrogenase
MTFPLFDLTGRRALVTGSSQGIGLALAAGLAAHGAKVVLNGRDVTKLDAAAERLSARGYAVERAPFDVTDPEAAAAGVATVLADGPVDILVNNAGMQFRTPLEEFPVDKWQALLTTNVSSIFYVSQPVARAMIARGRGKIINIASVQSELARPGIAPYTATKGAVRNLTRGMATDWAKHGLQINAIAPGYFKTPLNQALVDNPEFSSWLEKRTPAARWGTVDELVGAAVFLAGDASSFVNGHTLYVDGGITASV